MLSASSNIQKLTGNCSLETNSTPAFLDALMHPMYRFHAAHRPCFSRMPRNISGRAAAKPA